MIVCNQCRFINSHDTECYEKQIAELKEVLIEFALPPCPDSDLESLLKTLNKRAEIVLDRHKKLTMKLERKEKKS